MRHTLIFVGCFACYEPVQAHENSEGLFVQQVPIVTVVEPAPVLPPILPKEVPDNPYTGWKQWCEPVEYDKLCKTDSDCKGISTAAIGRPFSCVRPHWAETADTKVCAPGYPTKTERTWRYNRLREIVRQQYFDEVKHCALDGRPVHKEGWRCQDEWRQAEALTTFLWVVYVRETSARPWKRHRLNPDLKANEQAWVRRAPAYGWQLELGCIDGKKVCGRAKVFVKQHFPTPGANKHFGTMHRWKYGLGGLGQNAALWTDAWDRMAPPEILCKEVPAFETYLRRARNVVEMLSSGIDCDGDSTKDHWDKAPTWTVVHRGTSGGKVCPAKSARSEVYADKFRRRMRLEGMDAEGVASISLLGRPIGRSEQNDRMAAIDIVLEEKYPYGSYKPGREGHQE